MMFPSIFLFIFVTLLPLHSLVGRDLHAIFVADSSHDMNSITKPDLTRWMEQIRLIAKYSKMNLKEKVFTGKQFKKTLVKSYIEDLRVKKDDALLFYFSGHGYRMKEHKSSLPTLTFMRNEQGIELDWVAKACRAKKPRFTLIMSDCCNNYIERGFSNPSKRVHINFHPRPPNYSVYEQLFANARGSIVISSCSPGEFSYGSHQGGLYTQCFFASMNKELLQTSPNWRDLLRRCNGYIKAVQTPLCIIKK